MDALNNVHPHLYVTTKKFTGTYIMTGIEIHTNYIMHWYQEVPFVSSYCNKKARWKRWR